MAKNDENEVLSLIMRKSNALEILRGEKVREYRNASDHWCRIIGKFENPADKWDMTGIKDCFKVAHFYPYNKKWFLDVKILDIYMLEIDEGWADDDLYGKEYEGNVGDFVFVIELGDVIDTNLTDKKS